MKRLYTIFAALPAAIAVAAAPLASRARAPLFSSSVWKRLIASIRTGVPSNRERNVS